MALHGRHFLGIIVTVLLIVIVKIGRCLRHRGNLERERNRVEKGKRGLCISTKDGEEQDSTTETLIAYPVGTIDGAHRTKGGGTNLIVSTFGQSQNIQHPDPNYGMHFIAEAITAYPTESIPPSKGANRNLITQTIRGQDCPQVGNKGAVWNWVFSFL